MGLPVLGGPVKTLANAAVEPPLLGVAVSPIGLVRVALAHWRARRAAWWLVPTMPECSPLSLS